MAVHGIGGGEAALAAQALGDLVAQALHFQPLGTAQGQQAPLSRLQRALATELGIHHLGQHHLAMGPLLGHDPHDALIGQAIVEAGEHPMDEAALLQRAEGLVGGTRAQATLNEPGIGTAQIELQSRGGQHHQPAAFLAHRAQEVHQGEAIQAPAHGIRKREAAHHRGVRFAKTGH